jgi:hypothetical protein
MDLASLSAVKNWLNISNSTQDANIQACLTAASIYFLRETGRGPRNWQNVTASPFNQSVPYTEVYDGQSGEKLFTRNFPVNSVSLLQVNNVVVQPSSGIGMPGYAIDDQGRSIAIRAGGGGASPQTFAYVATFGNGQTSGAGLGGYFRPFSGGPQCVALNYMAGFNALSATNDLETIMPAWVASTAYTAGQVISDGTFQQQAATSGTSAASAPSWASQSGGLTTDGTNGLTWVNLGTTQAPYTVQIQAEVAFLADQGVKYFIGGASLTPVLVAPNAGQYFLVSPGLYLFNSADAGAKVLMAYNLAGTPQDIVLAVIQLVSLNYKRRDWIGQRSIMMKDVGSTSYTLDIDPQIKEVISLYRRSSFSS